MFVFYQIIGQALIKFIVIDTHRMLISAVASGLIGEVMSYLINGFVSLYFILAAFIIYIGALIMYNNKLRNMVVDMCIVCGKDIHDIDLVFRTEDGNETVCSVECNIEYNMKKMTCKGYWYVTKNIGYPNRIVYL